MEKIANYQTGTSTSGGKLTIERPVKNTAAQQYTETLREVNSHIKELQQNIRNHTRLFKKEGAINWGYVESLGYARVELDNLCDHFNEAGE